MKRFSKLFAILTLCLVVVFAFAACGGTNIEGKWEIEEMKTSTNGIEVNPVELGMKMTLTIDKDNKYSATVTMPSIAGSEAVNETTTGTYEFKDNKLTLKGEEEIEGFDMPYFELKNGKLVYEVSTADGAMTIKVKIVLKKV